MGFYFLYPRILHIVIGKRRYIEVVKVQFYIRKIKVRNKRKFIKKYKFFNIPILRRMMNEYGR